jgi:hypothetical protein
VPHFQFGRPVSGENFVNRTAELSRLEQLILPFYTQETPAQHHLLISAIRRVGKTSLLIKLAEQIEAHPQENIVPVMMDLEAIEDLPAFFVQFRQALVAHLSTWARARGKMGNLKTWVSRLKVKPKISFDNEGHPQLEPDVSQKEQDWRTLGRAVFDLLQQQTENVRFLVILDEIGLFVRNLTAADTEKRLFLNFLRAELNKPQTPPFIVCGSQNFLTIVSEIDPANFGPWRNSFFEVHIGNFREDALVDELLKPAFQDEGVSFELKLLDRLCRFIFNVTHGHPNMAQLFGLELKYSLAVSSPSVEAVEAVLFEELLPKLILNDEQEQIRALLNIEALGPKHTQLEALLREIVNKDIKTLDELEVRSNREAADLEAMWQPLRDWGYLSIDSGKIEFTYPFLRYWLMRGRRDSDALEELREIWNSL